MVIKGGSCGGAADIAAHLQRTDQNERAELRELRGTLADTLAGGLLEMEAVASGARSKLHFYHAKINSRTHEELTEPQKDRSIELLGEKLGLAGQPRAVVEHVKDGRHHLHVVWSRIDLATMKAIPDSHNYRVHEEVARQLEREFGFEHTQGAHIGRDGNERPARTPSDDDMQMAGRTGIDGKQLRAQIGKLFHVADSGKAFAAALDSVNLVLAQGDKRNVLVVVDAEGGTHAVNKKITGLSAAETRKRLADLDPNSLPSVEQAHALHKARAETREAAEGHVQTDAAENDRKAASEREQARAGQSTSSEPEATPAPENEPGGAFQARPGTTPDFWRDLSETLAARQRAEAERTARTAERAAQWFSQAGGWDALDDQQMLAARAAYDKWKAAKPERQGEAAEQRFGLADYVDYVQRREAGHRDQAASDTRERAAPPADAPFVSAFEQQVSDSAAYRRDIQEVRPDAPFVSPAEQRQMRQAERGIVRPVPAAEKTQASEHAPAPVRAERVIGRAIDAVYRVIGAGADAIGSLFESKSEPPRRPEPSSPSPSSPSPSPATPALAVTISPAATVPLASMQMPAASQPKSPSQAILDMGRARLQEQREAGQEPERDFEHHGGRKRRHHVMAPPIIDGCRLRFAGRGFGLGGGEPAGLHGRGVAAKFARNPLLTEAQAYAEVYSPRGGGRSLQEPKSAAGMPAERSRTSIRLDAWTAGAVSSTAQIVQRIERVRAFSAEHPEIDVKEQLAALYKQLHRSIHAPAGRPEM